MRRLPRDVGSVEAEAVAEDAHRPEAKLPGERQHVLLLALDEVRAGLARAGRPANSSRIVHTRPPTRSRASMTVTSAPRASSALAADSPASPAPATMTLDPPDPVWASFKTTLVPYALAAALRFSPPPVQNIAELHKRILAIIDGRAAGGEQHSGEVRPGT